MKASSGSGEWPRVRVRVSILLVENGKSAARTESFFGGLECGKSLERFTNNLLSLFRCGLNVAHKSKSIIEPSSYERISSRHVHRGHSGG